MTPAASIASNLRTLRVQSRAITPAAAIAYALTTVSFAVLFAKPMKLLLSAWWNDPNNGHGLLLAPLSIWLLFKSGRAANSKPMPWLGLAMLVFAVASRYAADLAAELFVMRGSMLVALAGLVVFYAGIRQLLHWWLPFTLLALCVPLPEVVLNSVALPLQFTASKIGASLLRWREIPVMLSGNVIRIPGQDLFVAEACSGLRSLTALISLGVLMGAFLLNTWPLRVLLVILTVPIAILINGLRVFITGFLVLFVSPDFGTGFMHTSEGMVMFGSAFLITGLFAFGLSWSERWSERMMTSRRGLAA